MAGFNSLNDPWVMFFESLFENDERIFFGAEYEMIKKSSAAFFFRRVSHNKLFLFDVNYFILN